MEQTVEAVYEGGILRLLHPVNLQERQRVTIKIKTPIVEDDPDMERYKEEASALLQSWLEVDEEEAAEQRETLEFLMKALDEDRPSYRKLFPPGWNSGIEGSNNDDSKS